MPKARGLTEERLSEDWKRALHGRGDGDIITGAIDGTNPYLGNSRTASVTEDTPTKPALNVSTSLGRVGGSSPGASQGRGVCSKLYHKAETSGIGFF